MKFESSRSIIRSVGQSRVVGDIISGVYAFLKCFGGAGFDDFIGVVNARY